MKKRIFKKMSLLLTLTLSLTVFSSYSLAANSQMNLKENNIVEQKKEESRVNGLLLGSDGGRTDLIMLVSYNYDDNKLDIVSIPRDTYIQNNEKAGAEHKKINSVYQNGGFDGLSKEIKDILGDNSLEIDKFVKLDSKGAENIIDDIGGVDVNVTSLKSNNAESISEGYQTLNGNQAMEYLKQRYGYSNGDLDRIIKHQEFIDSFISKAKDTGILKVAKSIISQLDTNIGPFDAIYYGYKARNINKTDVNFYTLPGQAEMRTIEGQNLSYFVVDKEETQKLMKEIFN